MDRKLEMHAVKTIRSLMVATSLAAGVTLVTGSQGVIAGCASRDHRTNCDQSAHPPSTVQNQNPNVPIVSPTVRQNGKVIYFSNVDGYNGPKNKGPSITNAPEKIYNRVNPDGSVDLMHQTKNPDGSWNFHVDRHTPPNPLIVGGF
jgi:hypothetical protein